MKKFFQKKRLKLLAIVLITLFFLFNGPIYSNIYIPKIIKTPEIKAQAEPLNSGPDFSESEEAEGEELLKAATEQMQGEVEVPEDTDSSKKITWLHPFQKALAWFLSWVLYMILKLVSVFLALAGMVLDAAMSFDKFLAVEEVKAGWKMSRDFCNMFFVLILLVIGFATIFRIEGYGAKRLLVKLIIAAILVNFSFVISGLIIDSSQVMMKSFRSTITEKSFSAAAARAAGMAKQYGNKDSLPTYKEIYNVLSWDAIGSVMKTIAFVVILFFVLLVIAAILTIRLIALWILVILSPFAYLLAILPKTQDLAAKWWQSFLKYCFIGPVMMFFMMLALKLGEGANQYTRQYTQTTSKATAFIGLTLESFLQFMIIVLLLIAGAMSATWLSIAGAGKVVGGVKDFAKGAGKLAGRATGVPRATRAIGWGARRKAALGAAGVLSRVPGFGGIGRRMKGAEQKRQEKEMEKKRGIYDKMSSHDRLQAVEHDVGLNAMTATRSALEKDDFKNASVAQVDRGMGLARKFNDTAALEKLEATRPSRIADPARRAEVMKNLTTEGKLKDLSPQELMVPEVMDEVFKNASDSQFRKLYSDGSIEQKQAIELGMQPRFRNAQNDYEVEKKYAKTTGKVGRATAHLSQTDRDRLQTETIQGMSGKDFNNLDDESTIIAGRKMSKNQLKAAGELSSTKKQILKREAQEHNPSVYQEMDTSPDWN